MPLEYRAGLVRDMIDKRMCPVSMLLHIGHDHAGPAEGTSGMKRIVVRLSGMPFDPPTR